MIQIIMKTYDNDKTVRLQIIMFKKATLRILFIKLKRDNTDNCISSIFYRVVLVNAVQINYFKI